MVERMVLAKTYIETFSVIGFKKDKQFMYNEREG